MIRHIVLFWFHDPSEEVLKEAAGKLLSMNGRIEGMASIEVGLDFAKTPRSCHLCLSETFESREALDRYRTHPVHIPVQQHMHAVCERSASADYEL